MLLWHGRPYLIDHGATLTFHHSWGGAAGWPARPYDARDHALAGLRPDIGDVDGELGALLDDGVLRAAVAEVPDGWLDGEPGFGSAEEVRWAYVELLAGRRDDRTPWVAPIAGAVAR
jgi:hypothetical protein